jgi:predicted ribosomally synthesized peptide with SipW-like signal peptide
MTQAQRTPQGRRWQGRHAPARLALSVLLVALAAVFSAVGTWSAFSATTSNSDNSFAAGTVELSDNDSASALLSFSAAVPGQSASGCIMVTYTGSLPATVRLYGTTGGTGLDPYLNLTVTRRTIPPLPGRDPPPPTFGDCTNFTADTTDWAGLGPGVLYEGTLQDFADDYTGGVKDGDPASPEIWTTNAIHAYKVTVTLTDNDSAQGKNATQTFTWEARNTSS